MANQSHSFLHYSCKRIYHLLCRNYGLIVLNWLKYDDLFDLYTRQQWIRILSLILDFWISNRKEACICSILLHLASCHNSAQFLLNSPCIAILKQLKPAAFIAILSTASLHANLDKSGETFVREQILNCFTPESSGQFQYRVLLGWENYLWKQLLRLFSQKQKTSWKKCRLEISLLDDLCCKNSVEAYVKCAERGIFVLPKEYLTVELTARQYLINLLMDELNRNDPSNLDHDLGLLTTYSEDSGTSLTGIFEVLVAVLWQPYSGVQLLRYFDCTLYCRELFKKIRKTGNFETVRKIRTLALNLDVAIELRNKAKLLKRIAQVFFCHFLFSLHGILPGF